MQGLGHPDPRKRFYMTATRVVRASPDVAGAETLLLGERQSHLRDGQPLCCIPPGGDVVLDFGRELAGGARLVAGYNGGVVTRAALTFGESVAEALGEPANEHAIHQTTLDLPPTGILEYGNTGFRFLRIAVPPDAGAGVDLVGAVAVALVRDLARAGRFRSSDVRLNRIWSVGADTVQWCMQDYVYDGAKRDRLVWIGDLYPEMRTILAVFDDVETVRETLDFAASRTDDGAWMNGISSYSAWWVVCQYSWYWRRGDWAYLAASRERLKRITARLAARVDAAGRESLDGMRFLDWHSADDEDAVHAGLQGMLAWCFACAERLAGWLDDEGWRADCRRTLARLRRHAVPVSANKSVAAMLAQGGLATPEAANAASLAVRPYEGLSTFFGLLLLETRARAGDMAGALDVLGRYWGGMLDAGATTFWEDFDLVWIADGGRIDEAPRPGRRDPHREFGRHCYQGLRHSLCHGWAGGPTAFLSEYVLGVHPRAPGFSRVSVEPALGGLEWVEGEVPTPFGPVHVEADRRGATWKLPDGIALVPQLQPASPV